MAHSSGARYLGREGMKKRNKITEPNAFLQNLFNGWTLSYVVMSVSPSVPCHGSHLSSLCPVKSAYEIPVHPLLL